jgi:hypothetical protein
MAAPLSYTMYTSVPAVLPFTESYLRVTAPLGLLLRTGGCVRVLSEARLTLLPVTTLARNICL